MNYIDEALKEAQKALNLNEVPVGAVIVKDNKIIAAAHNLKEKLQDPTAHAEMLAIKKACTALNNWRLNGCEMYVTLEPCAMCASAILQSRISKLYIGTFDPVQGACGSVIDVIHNRYFKRTIDVRWLYDESCSEILRVFFSKIR